jgi:hypothetical protein
MNSRAIAGVELRLTVNHVVIVHTPASGKGPMVGTYKHVNIHTNFRKVG